ncbi:immunoglobulin-like domain-containing protein [Thiomicrorhabdus sp. Kp2]|uniref:immunoglobulin-like domain-containing protein n=1 Tax=Thiomicrorhabdus sp. Kp2 TaxID=1123518 RepID=UPI00041D7686|nr:immunoglobulin-like domain-containing protein [Thiomicrorhabdus sp. Kp2]
MSTIVGNVSKLEGIVRAINPVTGEVRVLEAGSPVYAGEIIQTSGKGGVVVDMVNGTLLTLGRDTQMRLDDDVSGQASALDSGTEGAVDIEALQQAVLEGNFDALEATAAGDAFIVGTASDGGVTVERIASSGEVTSGFDTSVNETDQVIQPRTNDAQAVVEPIAVIPVVSISGQESVWEGNQATYTVTTDTVSSEDIIVSVVTGHVTTQDGDYVPVTQTVTIPAGQSSAQFTVQTTDDALADSGEQYTASIASATGAEFEAVAVDATANSVTTTIVDASEPNPPITPPGTPDAPDAGATVSIAGDATVWEGNQATYTVTTDTVSSEDILVSVVTGHVTTQAGDYVPVTQTVTIPAGQSSAQFTVQTTDDALADSGEQYTASITGATGAEFEAVAVDAAANSVTTTIVDASEPNPPITPPGTPDSPDAGATVSIAGDATVWEGNQATYTVTTDTVSSEDILVSVVTGHVTTQAGDYVPVTQTVTIPAGQSSAQFTVQTTDDALADSGEQYTASIASATGAEFEAVAVDATANSVTTTIVDASEPNPPITPPGTPDSPDAGATVSIAGDAAVWEGNTATYTVTTDTVSSEDIIVSVVTGHVTTQDGDYVPVTQDVIIPAGQLSAQFTVQTTDDALADSGEQYTASIASATGAEFEAVAVDATANSVTTTIVDASDPTPPVTPPGTPDSPDAGTELSISGSTSTLEGDSVEYTVSVTNAPLEDMDVQVTVSNISTNGDVIVGTQTVTIPAGSTEVKFTVDNVEDAIKETPEDYKVAITGYENGGYEAVTEGAMEVSTTITDDDSVIVASITDDTQTEGTVDNDLVHTVTMSGASASDEVYAFSLVDTTTQAVDHGTAVFSNGVTNNGDGTITVPAGVTSFTVSTTVTDDALADSGEYYTLNIGGQSATGTILDESNPYTPEDPDQPNEKDAGATVSIAGDATVWEGNQATYTVTTDTVSSEDILVSVVTGHVTTQAGDYVPVTQTVTIPAGQSSAQFTVQTTDDALADSGEQYTASIASATGAEFEAVAVDATANSVTTTIVDASDPTPPVTPPGTPDAPDAGATVSIAGDATVWEGNQATYTVTTDTVSSEDILVSVVTGHVTTQAGDYVPVTQTVTIPAGQSSAQFTVQTTDDALADSGEQYTASIASATGAEFEAVAVDATANSVTTTIVDASDPTPPVTPPGTPDSPDAGATVSIAGDATVWEGNQATYTVTTDTVSSEDILVSVVTGHVTTQAGDYVPVTQTVTIPAGQSSAQFTVQTTDDALADSGEQYTASIASATGAEFEAVAVDATANSVTTTIVDASDPTPPVTPPGTPDSPDAGATVSIAGDAAVWEGNTATYTVTTDTVSSEDIIVSVVTGHVTTQDGDYLPVTQTVTIPAGQSSAQFTVQTTDDALADSGEQYTASIASATGAEFEAVAVDATANSVTTTIVDASDPTPPVTPPGTPDAPDAGATVSIAGDATVWEGNQATYTVTTDTVSSEDILVSVVTGHVTTQAGDYVPVTQTVTIPAGQSSAQFTVQTTDDALADSGEQYTASIASATGAEFEAVAVDATANSVTTTIVDASDPTPPVTPPGTPDSPDAGAMVWITGDSSVAEGAKAGYTLHTDTVSSEDIVVTVTTGHITTEAGDYVPVNQDVLIPAGQSSVDFEVTTNDDNEAEITEQYSVSISAASGAEFEAVTVDGSRDSVTTDIIDNDEPSLSINDVSVNEDEGSMTFTVTLSNPSASTVTVDYVSSNGTATASLDYTAVTGDLTFAPGELTKTITVPVTDDFIAEGSETLDIILSNPVNATITDGTGLGIISDEPIPGAPDTISVSLSGDTTVTEGGTANYRVTLSETAITAMDVVVVTGHVTTENGDLIPTTMTVTVPAGSDHVDFTVSNNDDAYAEGDESYTVTLSGVTTGGGFEAVNVDKTPVETVIKDNTTPGTESDDEVINVTLTGDTSVAEGGTATYTVTLDQPTATEMQVEVQTGHITTDNGDLVPTTMLVTIPAGAASADFTVVNNQDTTAEGNENYQVALTGNNTVGGGFETVNIVTTPVNTTIVDNDVLSISINDVTVNEDAGTMTFTVSLSTDTTTDVTFDYASADNGSALAGSDYTAVSGSGTIAAGDTSTTITVPITDDYIAENPETFLMNLSNITPSVVVADAQGVGTIVDEGTPTAGDTITVSIGGTDTVAEGETASYTVTTDKPVVTDMIVDVTYSYVSAETGDIVEGVTSVTIPAGTSTSAPFTVATIDDAYLEGDEVYNVTISNPQGGGAESVTIGTATQATTIKDGADEPDGGTGTEDTATVSIAGDTAVIEGNTAAYTVSVDKAPTSDMTVDVTYSYASASSGDIHTGTTQVTIPAGQLSVPLNVATIDDAYAEGDEVYSVVISNPSQGGFENVVIDTDTVSTTISDNTTPGIEPNDEVINVTLTGASTVAEGGQASYTISVNEPTATAMNVEVIVGHIQTDNGDLTPVTQTVTIPQGATSVNFTVDNNQDNLAEGNELYSVALTGTTTGGGFETVNVNTTPVETNIIDDEGTPSLIIDNVTVNEDAGTLDFTVTLSNPTTEEVTFDYASSDGSAIAGSDYTAVNGSGSIAAGSTTTTISVPITDDYIAENPETFLMTLSNPSTNAQIADGQGVGTITDEGTPGAEDTVTLTLIGDAQVEESTQANYTVTADKPVETPLTVTVTTGHVTTEDGDYVAITQDVTIPAGQTSVGFTVDTIDDAYAEGSEDYTVTMSNPVGGGVENVVLGTSQVTTSIVDETSPASEDTATVSISGSTTVIEGETASYTLTVDRTPTTDLHVTVETGHITTENGDYVPMNTIVTIPAGSTTVNFTIDTNDDAYAETTEDFSVNLTGTSGGGFEKTIIGVNSVTTAITDETNPYNPEDPDQPNERDAGATVSIAGDATVWEGNQATYTVTTDTVSSEDILVSVVTGHVTTQAGDYVPVTQTVTIPAGQSSAQFTVQTTDDALADSGEQYTASITGATGVEFEAVAVDATANSVTTTIVDASEPNPPITPPGTPDAPDAGATVSIAGDATVWEGNQATYTVTTDTVSSEDILVSVVTGHVTTQAGDYVPVTQTVTIPAGQSSALFTVQTTDDALADSGEQYTASIASATGAEFEAVAVDATANSVTTTIVDASDPTPPVTPPGTPDSPDAGTELSISGSTSTLEGDSVEYTVSVTNAPLEDMDVQVTVSNISTNGDVIVGTQTVTIPAGSTEVKFTVDNVEDAIKETPEDYKVAITGYENGGYEAVTEGAMEVSTTITDDDDAPIANDIPPQNDEDADGISLDISTFFTDDNPLTYSATGLPPGLSINISTGEITGTIDNSASQGGTGGVYSVTVSATDGVNPPASSTFDWTVTNPGPDAQDDGVITIVEDSVGIAIPVMSNDQDPDNDNIFVSGTTDPSHGSITLNSNGTITYVPDANYNGPDSFTYTISDGEGGTDTATVTLNVTPDNDNPEIQNIAVVARVSEEGLVTGLADTVGENSGDDQTNSSTFTGNMIFTDIDGDTLTVSLAEPTEAMTSGGETITWSGVGTNVLTGSAGGSDVITVQVDNTGSYTVELLGPVDHPNNSVEDVLSISTAVTVSDGNGGSASANLSVVIEDDSPVSQDSSNSMTVDLDVIEIRNYSAGWVNPVSTAGDSSGITQINTDSDSYIDELQWGSGSNGSSGYDLVDASGFSSSAGVGIQTGDLLNFGSFTHNNFPVSGETLDNVDLTVSMEVVINGQPYTVNFTIPIEHTETTNSDDAEASRDIINLPAQAQSFTVNGQDYVVSIDGFRDTNGDVVETIYTYENAANSFDILGSVTSVDTLPTVTGTVSADAGADGSVDGVVWASTTSPYGTLTANSDGSYSFELNRETKDALTDGQNLQATFDYTITDKDGDSHTSTLTIDINGNAVYVDLKPESIDEVRGMDFANENLAQDTNIVITLDTSGSMSNENRLTLAKEALANMINTYDSMGTVNVKLVTFATTGLVMTNANGEVWMSPQEAINIINGLTDNNMTNYEDAVYETYNNYTEPAADKTVAYFISDGEPTAENVNGTQNTTTSGDSEAGWLDDSYVTGWTNFVNTYVDSAHVVALGAGITDTSYLDELATAAGVETTVVVDPNDLNSALEPELSVSGGALDNIGSGTTLDNVSGGDGQITIDSISVDGTVYTAADFPATGIAIGGQGKLLFDFATGQYAYSAKASEFSADILKTFSVTASDADGDATTFDVKVFVNVKDVNVIASEDFNASAEGWTVNGDTDSRENNALFIDRNETATKTYQVEPGENVTVSFDTTNTSGWESSDYFVVYVKDDGGNDVEVARHYGEFNDKVSFDATADSNGDLQLSIQVVTNSNNEELQVDNLEITTTSDNGLFLYGDDSESEAFIINSQEDVTIVDFDVANDVLDLSEVITDTDVTEATLGDYLNFTSLDSDNDGTADSTIIDVDADGDAATTNDITSVIIQGELLDENDINDMNIDFQND